MEQKLTLFELNQRVKEALLDAFPVSVWVVAEISELKQNRNGHCYLELIEKKGEEIIARARATIWSYTYRIIKSYFESTTKQSFSCDIKVLVKASVEYHPLYGFSLNIKDIDPAYTLGDMLLHRREIIERLKNEGVFNMNKELELPMVPQKIAVISSKTAAGYQDFINQLEMNQYGIKFHPVLFEAFMQGSTAVPSIISALEHIFKYIDVFDAVAIIRGGGAAADLSCFDNYNLAFHITQFPIPVITGIGHEKDDTIIDLIAHTRLKTPTAVAEFFINGAEQFYENILAIEEGFVNSCRTLLGEKKLQLENYAEDMQDRVKDFASVKNNQLLKISNQLQQRVSKFSFKKKYELNNIGFGLQSRLSVWNVKHMNLLNKLKDRSSSLLTKKWIRNKTELDHFSERLK
ncbi:MAG TPA: exodeoxyribonuclease VII large subunit, partial [Mariniphaga sp.]|nr:exodeoxyribonuclease VII large subunit [Mariniphaga sp.]